MSTRFKHERGFEWGVGALIFLALGIALAVSLRSSSPRGSSAAEEMRGLAPAVVERGEPVPAPDRRTREPTASALEAGVLRDEREGEGAQIRIRTVDMVGRPVPGALVLAAGNAESVEVGRTVDVGRTDEDGALATEVGDGWELFVVRADGFATLHSRVPRSLPSELLLRLHPAQRLRGQIVLSDGSSAGDGAYVVAFRSTVVGSPMRAALSALEGDPSQYLAESDATGFFEFPDLDPRRAYHLTAASPRLGATGWAEAAAGAEEVTIVLETIHAAFVELDETGGHPLTLSSATFMTSNVRLDETSCPDARRIFSSTVPLLLGIDPSIVLTRLFDRRLFLFTCPHDCAEIGPITWSFELTGYRRAEISFWARPIAFGLSTVHAELHRTSSGFGDLHVCFRELPELAPGTDAYWPLGWIYLRDHSGGRSFEYVLKNMPGADSIVDNVPFGDYSLVVAFTAGTTALPGPGEEPMHVRISSTPARVELDLAGLGWIEVLLEDADGSLYGDYVFLELMRLEPGSRGITTAALSAGPYVLPAIPPGTYQIELGRPSWRAPGASEALTLPVTVEAGRVAIVTFRRE